jgi:hypothetical protein
VVALRFSLEGTAARWPAPQSPQYEQSVNGFARFERAIQANRCAR